jgi:hypothetical protein
MNAAQRKTLQAIFETPTRADVCWRRIEALVRALGGEVTEGRGSRVRFRLGDRVATFHGPHPSRATGKEPSRTCGGSSRTRDSSHDGVQGVHGGR